MNIFKSLMYLEGPDSVTSRRFEEKEPTFSQTYGNRVAFTRMFGLHGLGKPLRPQQVTSAAWGEPCSCG